MGSTGLLEAASVSQRQASPNRVNAHQPRREPNPCPANWASDFASRTRSNIGNTTFANHEKNRLFASWHFPALFGSLAPSCGIPRTTRVSGPLILRRTASSLPSLAGSAVVTTLARRAGKAQRLDAAALPAPLDGAPGTVVGCTPTRALGSAPMQCGWTPHLVAPPGRRREGTRRWTRCAAFAGWVFPTRQSPCRHPARHDGHTATEPFTAMRPCRSRSAAAPSFMKPRHGCKPAGTIRTARLRQLPHTRVTLESRHSSHAITSSRPHLHSMLSRHSRPQPTQSPSSFMIPLPGCRADRQGGSPRSTPRSELGFAPEKRRQIL